MGRSVFAPSPCLRGEVWGEGNFSLPTALRRVNAALSFCQVVIYGFLKQQGWRFDAIPACCPHAIAPWHPGVLCPICPRRRFVRTHFRDSPVLQRRASTTREHPGCREGSRSEGEVGWVPAGGWCADRTSGGFRCGHQRTRTCNHSRGNCQDNL